jgi:hypothetical protein
VEDAPFDKREEDVAKGAGKERHKAVVLLEP